MALGFRMQRVEGFAAFGAQHRLVRGAVSIPTVEMKVGKLKPGGGPTRPISLSNLLAIPWRGLAWSPAPR